nr:glycosyltransferase family 2 protein [Metabacillus mangrovi]
MKNPPSAEKGISILVPCYNEESIIQTAIEGMLALDYSNYEVLFINDGSSDLTMERLHEDLKLKPAAFAASGVLKFNQVKAFYQAANTKIKVLDKVNGGKADALNAGISYAEHSIIITLDADSLLKPDSLKIINGAFEDKKVIAAGGMVHVLQGRNLAQPDQPVRLSKMKQIVRFQTLEYIRGFFTYKASLAKSDALSIISGAFGIFKKDVLLDLYGFRKTVGEDMDITLKVQQYRKKHRRRKVLFIPEAICYTEVPESYKDLFKQRVRWQKAFTDCMMYYGKTLFPTVFKKKLSFFIVFDALCSGVLLSFFTLFFLVTQIFFFPIEHTYPALLFFLSGAAGSNLLYALISLKISTHYRNAFSNRDMGYLAWTILADLLVYRFFTLFFTIYGTIAYFGKKDGWNKVARTGKKYIVSESDALQKADV